MNEERKQQILDIFDDKVELKNPSNREIQEIINQLIIETYQNQKGGNKDD